MVVDSHPCAETLGDYALGRLADRELAEVAEHIETCDGCQKTLNALPPITDQLVNDLVLVEPDERFASEPELAAALAKVRRLAPDELSAASADELAQLAQHRTDAPSLAALRDYQLLAPLGRGGMGIVYQARHMRLDRLVAIKVLPTDRMRRPEAIDRFSREMRAVGKLDHPNIVRAFDAGEIDGNHFLVMELVDGIDLSALAARIGPMRVADACELVRQAAVGLDYAHRHGLIHRDVKPSNLMLGRDGVVKVLDLGLARLADDRSASDSPLSADPGRRANVQLALAHFTDADRALGTPDYMAPEQLTNSSAVDGRNDVYSVGATLYRLLVGRAPYSGPNYDTVAKKLSGLAADDPAPITDDRQDLPIELVALLSRMLARNPADRPAMPADVAAALTPFTRGHQICTTAFGEEPPTRLNMRPPSEVLPTPRRPIAIVGLLLVCIGVGIVILVTAVQMSNGPIGRRGDTSVPDHFVHDTATAGAGFVSTQLGQAYRDKATPPRPGTWELTFPAGFARPGQILSLGGDQFLLRRFGIADGVYRWDCDQLVVERPKDRRFVGFVWARDDDDELVLVDEPANHPSGSSYLGARLRFLRNADNSSAE